MLQGNSGNGENSNFRDAWGSSPQNKTSTALALAAPADPWEPSPTLPAWVPRLPVKGGASPRSRVSSASILSGDRGLKTHNDSARQKEMNGAGERCPSPRHPPPSPLSERVGAGGSPGKHCFPAEDPPPSLQTLRPPTWRTHCTSGTVGATRLLHPYGHRLPFLIRSWHPWLLFLLHFTNKQAKNYLKSLLYIKITSPPSARRTTTTQPRCTSLSSLGSRLLKAGSVIKRG